MSTSNETLLNRSFVSACLANLLFFFSFYLLMPVLPLYLVDELHAEKSLAGIILSAYTISALMIRPVSGMLVDSFQRKPLFLLCYFVFAAYFLGYLLAGTLLMLLVLRSMHGLVFGIATTTANTLAIDTLPAQKLGRGVGIFGTTSSLAMSLGPMAGLLLLGTFSYQAVFLIAFLTAAAAFLIGSTIHCKKRDIKPMTNPFSLNRLFLAKGWLAAISIFLAAFLYGVLLNYLSLFARERGIVANPGYFFCLFAVGLILSRFLAGRMIDNGHLCRVIVIGKTILIAAVLLFVYIPDEKVFFGASLFIGFGFGMISPSYQTIFIRLAPSEQRGTANSTYLTAWDAGIGLAILTGGLLAEWAELADIFLFGAALVGLSMLLFTTAGAPHFRRNRLS